MAKLMDWVAQVEKSHGLVYKRELPQRSADCFVLSFTNKTGEPVHAHVYDERITISNTKLRLMFSNFFKCYLALRNVDCPIVKPYNHLRHLQYLGFIFHTPKKGHLLDVMSKTAALSDDQAMCICIRILQAIDVLYQQKLQVIYIPIKAMLVDLTEISLDILDYIMPRDIHPSEVVVLANYMMDTVSKADIPLLPPEVVLDKHITYQTGVYSFGVALYTLIEVDEL